MAKGQPRNYLQFQHGADIRTLGRLVAEHDQHLAQYYVNPERFVGRANDIQDPAVFFVGPKGAGKSAVLHMVRLLRGSDSQRVIDISPDDLAFSSLANVQASTPLMQDVGKYQWIFKSLWDYILTLELLRRELPNRKAFVDMLTNWLRGPYEREARRLLDISVSDEGNPHSLSERILQLVKEVELGTELAGVKGTAKITLDQGVVNTDQLKFLGLVNSVSKNITGLLRHPYFILIDDLDTHWTDSPVQNAFIAALFSSLRRLSRPPNLKCVVAIRDQIYRRLPIEDKDKFRDWVVTVTWDSDTLKKMIQKRVIFALTCNESEVWDGVFPQQGFQKMLAHTTHKPRELLRLSMISIEEAIRHGHPSVFMEDIDASTRRFSEEKIEELTSEWSYQYRSIDQLVRRLTGWPPEFPLDKFKDFAYEVAYDIEIGHKLAQNFAWAKGYGEDAIGLAEILLRCGVLLHKPSRTSLPRSYDPYFPEEITANSWFAIHPMYGGSLGLIGG